MVTAKNRFQIHRYSAKTRNIPFELTFDEWYNWWLSHGIDKEYPQKRGPNMPCMCRYGDTGPYNLSNIYFDTSSNNVKYANTGRINYACRKTVKTPYGTFDSGIIAAEKLNISRKKLWTLMKKNPQDYFYV